MHDGIPEAADQSFLMWYLQTLGVGGLMIAAAALVAFTLTMLIVLRGKNMTSGSALMLIVPLPLLAGFFSMLKGMMASFGVIVRANVQITVSEIAAALAETSASLLFAILAMAPSYLLAMGYLFSRSLRADSSDQRSDRIET